MRQEKKIDRNLALRYEANSFAGIVGEDSEAAKEYLRITELYIEQLEKSKELLEKLKQLNDKSKKENN